MDPNEALARMRRLTTEVESRGDRLARDQLDALLDEYAEAVRALDDWVSAGGFLPLAWAAHRRRPGWPPETETKEGEAS